MLGCERNRGLFGDTVSKLFWTVDISVEMRTGHLQITESDRLCLNQLTEMLCPKRDNVGDYYRLDLLTGSRDKKFLQDLLG